MSLESLSIFAAIVGVVAVVLFLAASINMVKSLRLKRSSKAPHMAVVVTLTGSRSELERTLRSIGRSSYRNFTVVLLAQNKTVALTNLERSELDDAFSYVIKYFRKRSVAHLDNAAGDALKKVPTAESVVVMHAGQVLAPDSINTAALTALTNGTKVSARINIPNPDLRYVTGVTYSVGTALKNLFYGSTRMKVNEGDSVWVIDSTQLRTRGFNATSNKAGTLTPRQRTLLRVNVFVVVVSTILLLIVTSQNSPDAFTGVWFATAVSLFAVTLLDAHSSLKQKSDVLMCMPFLPLIMLASLIFSGEKEKAYV